MSSFQNTFLVYKVYTFSYSLDVADLAWRAPKWHISRLVPPGSLPAQQHKDTEVSKFFCVSKFSMMVDAIGYFQHLQVTDLFSERILNLWELIESVTKGENGIAFHGGQELCLR